MPSFFVPTPGNLTAQESPPPGICQPGGGGWAQVELTDALIASIWTHSICQMQATFLGVELELERLGV